MNESHPFVTPLTSEYEPDWDASLDPGIAKGVKILRGEVTMPDPYTRFKKVLNQCLEMLGSGSLQWPLHWVALAPNGMILKGSYTDMDEPRPESTAQGEPSPERFMAFPMHYLFVDSTGKGTHIVVRSFSRIELLGCG